MATQREEQQKLLESAMQTLESAQQQFTEQFAAIKNEKEAVEAQQAQSVSTITKQKQDIATLETTLVSLKELSAKSDTELHDAKAKITEMEKEINEKSKLIAVLTESIQDINMKYQEAVEKGKQETKKIVVKTKH